MSTGADPAPGANLLFLRDSDLRLAQDLLLLAHRDVAAAADAVLAAQGLGRAHHRVLHFVGRNPGIAIGALLALLGITKQSLARVMEALLERQLVAQVNSRGDRRQRLLTLTDAGAALERALFAAQRERLARAYRLAGGPAVQGFRAVMRLLLDETARQYVDRHAAAQGTVTPADPRGNPAPPPR